ncbi:MAG TPA: hypothetical protein VGM81_16645 [Burkholderiaceae bacterium]
MTQIAAVQTYASTHLPTQVELALPVETRARFSAHESVGFSLGRDFAAHGLTPPVEHLFASSPLREGWQAGRSAFGRRTLRAKAQTRLWLMLRTHAWLRGRSFEDIQLTPLYLQQIEVSHCPITRTALSAETRSIDRVRNDAGYAAGNLVMMSSAANQAKADLDFAAATERALSVAHGPIQSIAGLGPAEWQRVAILTSYVTELPHAVAAQLPMTVLPPNRLRLFNPIQALQALITRQLAVQGWSQRLARLEALLPGEALKADFNRFLLALAPRVLALKEEDSAQQSRWALEDAWTLPLVQKRWAKFALQLDAQQAEDLVTRAARLQLATVHVQQHESQGATEGWALERRGFCGPVSQATAWH